MRHLRWLLCANHCLGLGKLAPGQVSMAQKGWIAEFPQPCNLTWIAFPLPSGDHKRKTFSGDLTLHFVVCFCQVSFALPFFAKIWVKPTSYGDIKYTIRACGTSPDRFSSVNTSNVDFVLGIHYIFYPPLYKV